MTSAPGADRAREIRLLALDVDGTLTDGTLLIGGDAEIAKPFSVRDGFGLNLLRQAGIEIAIITARQSAIVERRAAELGIGRVHQGGKDKRARLRALCDEVGIEPARAAYMGDDWPDLAVMACCGLAAAPADAAPEVIAAAHWVSTLPAGRGAVRELAMFILDAQGRRAELLARYAADAPDRPGDR